MKSGLKKISEIIEKKKKFTNHLKEQESLLRVNILRQLLSGNNGNISANDILEFLDINFCYDNFMVIIFLIENAERMSFGNVNEEHSGEKQESLLANVMNECLSSDECSVTSLEEDSCVTFILNVKENTSETIEFVKEKIAEGRTILEEERKLFFNANVSDIHGETDGIALGYSEAMRCIEQRFILEKEETILFCNLETFGTVGYHFPLDVEQKLIYCLKTGEYEGCSEILDDIYNTNINEREIDLGLAKCLMYDVLGAVAKSLAEIYWEAEKIACTDRMFEYVLASPSANGMMEKIKNVFRIVCNDVRRMPANSSSNLIAKIDEYLCENFFDTSLNVTSVALRFDMNTTYLSNMYKKKKGIGLLEYLTNIRLEKAKELLREDPHITIEDLCKKVGVGNVRTFSRVFVKYVGVTPGKFKDLVLKKKSSDEQEGGAYEKES